MFDSTGRHGSPAGAEPVSCAEVAGWLARLSTGVPAADSDVDAVDQIALLERLKSAAAGLQAVVTAGFAAGQRAEQEAAGVRRSELGRGVGSQVGWARRDSPSKGGRHVGLAQALVADMPHTLAALRRGETSEWRASVMVRETICLSREGRRAVDAAVGPHLGEYGDKRVESEARRHAYLVDPAAALARTSKAETDRRVTVRPAPDTMGYLTALLPVGPAVAAYTALRRHADRCKAAGDTRSRGQIMADELVARLTGAATADATDAELVVIVSGDALFAEPTDTADGDSSNVATDPAARDSAAGSGDADTADVGDSTGENDADTTAGSGDAGPAAAGDPSEEAGIVVGFGPAPASWIRRLARNPDATMWIRRGFADPDTGALIALESKRRLFPAGIRQAVIVRDQTCRAPYCDAPIRQVDHVHDHADGGPTSFDNADGLCQACNLNKQAPGLSAHTNPDGSITTTTPTGHTYASHAPPLPGTRRRTRGRDHVSASAPAA